MSESKKTILYKEHLALQAKMVPFGGWDMPIQYEGIISETEHCRSSVSLFDTCHMGEFFFKGNIATCGIEKPISFNISELPIGKCKYGFLLDTQGCVIDDLIIYRLSEKELMFVVNAGTCENDFNVLNSYLEGDFEFKNISDETVKLDVQGPQSRKVMKKLFEGDFNNITYFGFSHSQYKDHKILISRTGYTGELGFEIYADRSIGAELWKDILADESVKPAGLGARDILRLEMGMSLYGSDIDNETTPIEAGLSFFVDFNKEFVGKDILIKQKEEGTSKKKIAFVADNRRSPRHGYKIFSGNDEIGIVTSGVFSPMLKRGIGLGFVKPEYTKIGTDILIRNGKTEIKAKVTKTPFYKEGSAKD